MAKPSRKRSFDDHMDELVGESWASEPLSGPEDEFAKVCWAAFVSRCNAAHFDRERLQCICCNRVVKCPTADPFALYLHVGSKIGIGRHPTASTYQRWEREWESANPTASSSIDPGPSRPPPWVLEAEENRLDAEEEERDAQSRPLASRNPRPATSLQLRQRRRFALSAASTSNSIWEEAVQRGLTDAEEWRASLGENANEARSNQGEARRFTQDSEGRNLCWAFQKGDCDDKTGSSRECTDRPWLGHACEWCRGKHPGYKCIKKPHGARNGGLSKIRGRR